MLVFAALALITVYFRESDSGALHGVQGAGATVLRPFEIAAERVARPFEDGYGYVSGLVHAKSDLKRVEAENTRLRQQITQNTLAAGQVKELQQLLDYKQSPSYPQDYRGITVQQLSVLPNAFERQIVIDKGVNEGVRKDAAVVTADGLLGKVTAATSHTARVTLLTDPTSNVSALDARSRAAGLIAHAGRGDQLILDRVRKEDVVRVGDTIVTLGSLPGKLRSLYPAGIPIGKVTGWSQNDIDIFKQIQVEPFADFSAHAMLVLVPKPTAPELP